ncbi:MAG TPA: O-antigen ligase family protein [Verrucomicrobiae bacterium]|nr:O-antigen ligase family protein [Verrucomicrobiae bacterium]
MQSLPKSLFVFVFCVPLALVLGIMLATPLDRNTLIILGCAFLLLLTPVLLTSHHALLIASWNAFMIVFFLPGQPYLWMIMAVVSIAFTVLTRTLNRGKIALLNVRGITIPLLLLVLVTYIMCELTGGAGAQALGSDVFGGKRYYYLWGAILGYFALSNIPVVKEKRHLLAAIFFLSGVTAGFSNLAFVLGKNFYFLFTLFPVEWAMIQAAAEYQLGAYTRIGGLGPVGLALVYFFFVRYGIRGTFNLRYPWRLPVFLCAMIVGMFSGYRTTFLLVVITFAMQFLLEGLPKTKYLGIFGGALVLIAVAVMPFANRFPLPVQRCLSLLPLDLDRTALEEARGSTLWRLEMWRQVIPDIPKYFWVGKGYAIDPKDLYFAQQNISLRATAPYEEALVAGDYHNGPLTLIIPFGIWGVVVFGWFCAASIRLLWRNYQFGDPEIQNINTCLFAAFLAKLIYFIFIFGAFYLDLAAFTGLVALSVSMNHGMARRPAPAPLPVRARPEPEPELALPERFDPEPVFTRRFQGA